MAISKTYITVKDTEDRVGTRNTVYVAGIAINNVFLPSSSAQESLPSISFLFAFTPSFHKVLGSLFHQYGKLVYDKVHVLRYVQLGIDKGRLTYG